MAGSGATHGKAGVILEAGHSGDRLASVRRLVFPLLIIVAGSLAYANSLQGVFIFDDPIHIQSQPRIRRFWPIWELLSGRRPVVDFTLAINYAISEFQAWSYHALNLIVHILAALSLYGVVRRTVSRLNSATASSVALVSALLFVVHPLQTQSVTYIIQRGESMMGLFFLLTLYCFIRGASMTDHDRASQRAKWFIAAIAACAAGMGTKAVMVTAPLVVLLYDRTFFAGSLGAALAARRPLYIGLGGTWVVLGLCGVVSGIFSTTLDSAAVGFSYKGISPIQYALTQAGVLIHYLRLTAWPSPLCLDYQWPVAATSVDVALPGLIIATMLVACVLLWRRRSWLGFVVASVFLILAPTSSIVPIKDPLFEHRMYLALAGLAVIGSVCGREFLWRVYASMDVRDSTCRKLTSTIVGLLVILAIAGTHRRNTLYHSAQRMWSDVIDKRPNNAVAYQNLGTALLDSQQYEAALSALRTAVRLRPDFVEAYNNLGLGLLALRREAEAVQVFNRLIEVRPDFAPGYSSLGYALAAMREYDRALEQYAEALRLRPNYANAFNNRGLVYALGLGDFARAIEDYDQAIALNPLDARTYYNRGFAHAGAGNIDRAIADYHEAIQREPGLIEAHMGLGNAWATKGAFDRAVEAFDRAFSLNPAYTQACFRKAIACEGAGRPADALQTYRRCLQIASPNDANIIGRVRERIRKLEGR